MQRYSFLRLLLMLPAGLPRALRAAPRSMRAKLDAIENKQVPSGETIHFARQELLDYAREELVRNKVSGIRNANFVLANNYATCSASIDFHRVQESVQGRPPGMLSRLLLSGERDVEVELRLSSERGWCRVDVLSVEVDGWDVSGRALDWLIDNYVKSRYPRAKINAWFELESNIKQVALTPAELKVLIA
ncbi:MAG: hypothetical protein ABI972_23120 [Acidobacteriota bacterium]